MPDFKDTFPNDGIIGLIDRGTNLMTISTVTSTQACEFELFQLHPHLPINQMTALPETHEWCTRNHL